MHRMTFERNSSQGYQSSRGLKWNKTYKLRRSIITNYSQKRRRTYSVFRLVGSGDRVKQSVNQTFSFKAFTVNFSDLQVV